MNYNSESKEVRELLDASRRAERGKWERSVAGRPCFGAELKQLLDEGRVPIPSRWVDTNQVAHLQRAGGPIVPPEMKSRLRGRGDL